MKVSKISLLIGVLLIFGAILSGGKVSINFGQWPPGISFPVTSLLWRLTVFGLGVFAVYCGLPKASK